MKQRLYAPAVMAVLGAFVLAGCASDPGSGAASRPAADPSPSSPSQPKTGTVRVLYAGSLVNLMKDVQPAFHTATGGTIQGESGGSDALVTEIKGKIKEADVFVSASTGANSGLLGAKDGNWESWYAEFATAPLVIAYSPKSKFAADLTSKPWPQVVEEAGFKLGSTDPTGDPKGELAVHAMRQAGVPTSKAQIFPEDQMLARLASGNLDAGFFYSSEAADLELPTISLSPVHLAAHYTVTVLNRAPDATGGQAFVKWLMTAPGKALLTKHGLTLTPVKVTGGSQAVPGALRPSLGLS